MSSIIVTENVNRSFASGRETIHALKNVNISVEKGTLTILRGRSGSGKTTLLNLLGALDYPTGGNIFFDNKDITKMPQKERDEIRRKEMGFVFQSVALISLMSAYENVEFGLRIAGFDIKQRRDRAVECLNQIGRAHV